MSARIRTIDAFRAAAVLIVAIMHVGLDFVPGDGGVVIFFTISGFVITSLVLREHDRTGGFDIGGFYVRRALKLFPPLIVSFLIPVTIYAFFATVDWRTVLSQMAFSYNWVMVYGQGIYHDTIPGTSVMWSLAIEEQFYLVFAAIWLVVVARPHRRAWLLGIAVAGVLTSWGVRAFLLIQAGGYDELSAEAVRHLARGTDARIGSIAMGTLVALGVDAWRRGSLPWLSHFGRDGLMVVAILIFPASSVLFRNDWTETMFRIPAQELTGCLLILYAVVGGTGRLRQPFERICSWGWVQTVGLASYSIYIVHVPVFIAVHHVTAPLPDLLEVPLVFAIGVGAGIALYHLVEIPALRFKERRFRSTPLTVPTAS